MTALTSAAARAAHLTVDHEPLIFSDTAAMSAMSALLDRHGFGEVTHVGQHDMVDGTLWSRTDALRPACLFPSGRRPGTGVAVTDQYAPGTGVPR